MLDGKATNSHRGMAPSLACSLGAEQIGGEELDTILMSWAVSTPSISSR